jgi:hypothetical protein
MSYTIACLNIVCVKNTGKADPVYRIFLDDQLIVERRFWPESPDYFIQEQITLQDDNAEHNIWVKNVYRDRGKIVVNTVKFFDGDNRAPIDLAVENLSGRYTFKTVKR